MFCTSISMQERPAYKRSNHHSFCYKRRFSRNCCRFSVLFCNSHREIPDCRNSFHQWEEQQQKCSKNWFKYKTSFTSITICHSCCIKMCRYCIRDPAPDADKNDNVDEQHDCTNYSWNSADFLHNIFLLLWLSVNRSARGLQILFFCNNISPGICYFNLLLLG